MAGHFQLILHRKAVRALRFARIIQEITIFARLGSSGPDSEPRRRAALTLQ
jgi:hypothetical protein